MNLSSSRKAALALAALWGAFFLPHLLTDGVPFYRDELITILPIKHYLRDRLLSGQLPEWYPYEGLGVPFIGQIATGTFHPQSFVFLLLPPALAVKWNVLAAYAVALAGAYRFARVTGGSRHASVAGAISFGFGGYALGVSHNLVYLASLAALPFVGELSVRLCSSGRWRDVVLLGAAWALTFLAGDAQSFALVPLILVASSAFSAAEKRSRLPPSRLGLAFFAAAALAVTLSAAELLPALALSGDSVRGVGTAGPTIGLTWALHPLRLFELVCAGFVPDVARNDVVRGLLGGESAVWATTLYLGAVPLALAAIGASTKRRGLLSFATLALLALWLSLGDRGGLQPLLRAHLPLFDKFRYPEKYLSLFWLALVPLVARGVDAANENRARTGRWFLATAAVLGIAALGMGNERFASWLLALRGAADVSFATLPTVLASAWRHGFGAAALAAGTAAGVLLMKLPPARAGQALCLVIFAELLVGNGGHLPLVPRSVVEAKGPFADRILSAGAPSPRIARWVEPQVPLAVSFDGVPWVKAIRATLFPSTSGLDQVTTFGTNLPARPWRYALTLSAAEGPVSAFNGCFATVALGSEPADRLVASDEQSGVGLLSLPCAPRAFVAPATKVADAREAAAKLTAAPSARQIWIEAPSGAAGFGTANIRKYAPEEVVIDVSAEGMAALYLSDQFAKGWTATVDDAEVPIYAANAAGRAVLVPGGDHRVQFRYRTPLLGAGLALSALGWLLLLAVVIAPKLRPRPVRS